MRDALPRFQQLVHGLVSSGLGVFSLRVVSRGLSLLSTLLLAHALGPAHYGTYSFAVACAALLTTPNSLGLDKLSVRVVSSYLVHSAHRLLSGYSIALLAFTLLISLALSLGLLAISVFASNPYVTVLPFAGLILLIQSMTRALSSCVHGAGHPEASFIPTLLVAPGVLCLGLLITRELDIVFTTETALLLSASSMCVALSVSGYFFWQHAPRLSWSAFDLLPRKWLADWSPLIPIALSTTLSAYSGIFVLGALSTPDDVGYYQIAMKAAALASIMLVAAENSLAPRAVRLLTEGASVSLEANARRSASLVLAVTLPLCVAFLAFPKELLQVFGSSFADNAQAPLRILAGGYLLRSLFGCGPIILMMGHSHKQGARLTIFSTLLSIFLSILLVPYLGAVGAALGTSFYMVTWSGGAAVLVYRSYKVDPTVGSLFRRLLPS